MAPQAPVIGSTKCEAAVRMFAEKGFSVRKEDFIPFVGMGENRYLGGVAEKYGCPFNPEVDKPRAYEIYAALAAGRLQSGGKGRGVLCAHMI